MKHLTIKENTFRTCCDIFYNCKFQEVIDNYDLGEGVEETTAIGKFVNNGSTNTIWIKDIKNKGVIAHEIIHLVFSILTNAGIPIRIENDETFAYLFEYYYNEIHKELTKKKI